MRRAIPFVIGIVVACLPGDAGRPLGSQCSSSAGCEDGLVCAYGRCRAECTFDRDCPAGAECVVAEGSVAGGVCRLVDEGCDSSPCTPDQLCVGDGDCIDRFVPPGADGDADVDGDGDADSGDGGDGDGDQDADVGGDPRDADVGAGLPHGSPCDVSSDCVAGATCVSGGPGVTHGLCARRCSADSDCLDLGLGSICWLVPGATSTVCSIDCDPVAAEPCAGGLSGDGVEESTCDVTGNDCESGLICVDMTSLGTICVQLCDSVGDCADGRICPAFSPPLEARGITWGFCWVYG